MARKSKSVYERIEEKKQVIKETEELLVRLNNELQELYLEKDDLEMHQLLEQMKENKLDINKALELLKVDIYNEQPNTKSKKDKTVKAITAE